MTEHLPDTQQRWWQLAAIQMAGSASIPVVLVGAKFTSELSNIALVISVIGANALLLGIGILMILMSYKRRLNVVELSGSYLGRKSTFCFAIVIVVEAVAWFSFQLRQNVPIIAGFIQAANVELFVLQIGVIIGLIVTVVTMFGIRGIKWWCVLASVPIFAYLIRLAILGNYGVFTSASTLPYSMIALPILVSITLPATIDYPTFFRHSKSLAHSIVALLTIFFLTTALQLLGLALFQWLGATSSLWIVIYVLLTTFSVNATNVYSGSVGWELIAPKLVGKKEYIILSLAGTVLFVISPLPSLELFMIEITDVLVSAAGTCLIVMFLIARKTLSHFSTSDHRVGSAAWVVGSAMGLAVHFHILPKFHSSILWAVLSSAAALGSLWYSRHIARKIYSCFSARTHG